MVKAVIHRKPSDGWILKSATISQEPGGIYYASMLFKYNSEVSLCYPESVSDVIGLDMNESTLYVDSDGATPKEPANAKVSRALLRQQKKLSHMIESHIVGYRIIKGNRVPIYDRKLSECKNIQKQRRRIAKKHAKQLNQHKDFLHKTSNQITNDYSLICIEDLSIKDMMLSKKDEPSAIKRHNVNRKAVANGWYKFTVMLEHKACRKGKFLIKIPKYYASSQICSCCGHINPEVKDPSVREWTCPDCNTHHDRDYNAAINIRNKGYEMFLSI